MEERRDMSTNKQIEKLANFILEEIPGEPSESAGAVDTAIRLLKKKNLENLEDLIEIQCSNGNWNYDSYMMGMANGMLLSRHIVTGRSGEVPYMTAPKKWLKDYPTLWTKIKWKLFPNSMVASGKPEAVNQPLK